MIMIRFVVLIITVLVFAPAQADERFITLSSTTSTQDSGLFGHILPIFTAASGITVHVVAVGTGQALAIGARGDADALLVHDRAGEDKFVADGFGIDRCTTTSSWSYQGAILRTFAVLKTRASP
jgi:tungstate transport system substrate-binding protein